MVIDIMSSEFRTGQGAIIPTLFLGLGGTGSRIVDRIAARARRLPNWESQLRPLTHFASVDTNELDQHKLRNIPEGNRLNVAAFDKARALENFRRSKDPQALQWLDPGYQPRPGYKPGAGQIRIESRLGFFYHSADLRQRLKELVAESLRPGITWRQQSPPKFNVYIFSTLAGGTGSGCFLSAAYLVEEVIREQSWQPRVIGNLLLSTLMLDKVGPELHPDIHANTYAALKELEHLTKLDYDQVKREGRTFEEFVYCRNSNNRAEIPRVKSRPFFLAFIIDRPPHIDLPDAEASIADAAYLQIMTPIIDNLAGELDNYEKRLEELTHFPGDLKNVGQGYTKNFGAFGAAAMVLPGEDLLDYSAYRFAAHAIRSQITFGIDTGNPGDDRARALAKLGVDYSDPKFLKMSDEGREQRINGAFVISVQEMARQDEHEELLDGFWFRLVEGTDSGRPTGMDEKGEVVRGESTLQLIGRKLGEERARLLQRVSIKERAFVFHREGINQYVELVSRLIDEIRAGRQQVEETVRGLVTSADEGESIADLKLDPIAERYLVIRLLDLVESSWIPQAQQDLEKVRTRDLQNPKVRERLERELLETLKQAAAKKTWLKGDQAFLDARDEAQEYYRGVASAAIKTLDAEIRLRQLRALLEYVKRRSRQFARLATRMDSLVVELEREAELLRRGETARVPALALRVEVLETLDEPRDRLWDDAFRRLFTDGGRYMSIFDRKVLALTITEQLKPVIRPDGTVAEKSVEQTVADLRRALLDLGRIRLRPTIFGDEGQKGLDLMRGLELEAQIVLEKNRREGEGASEAEIAAYREKKFRALAQLAGVMARVTSSESMALDDGVIVNRTRQLIVGIEDAAGSRAAAHFLDRLKSVLGASGRQVKVDSWHDPRLAIVHDVELPIPISYIEPVTGEIEEAYLQLAKDERRSYQLHTDFAWEKSLPNLNPRRSEVTVGWALQVLAIGLVTRVLDFKDGAWFWRVRGEDHERLGDTLASALYRLGEIHRNENLVDDLNRQLTEERRKMGPEVEKARRVELVEKLGALLNKLGRKELRGEMSRNDLLDRPILRVLIEALAEGLGLQIETGATRTLDYSDL